MLNRNRPLLTQVNKNMVKFPDENLVDLSLVLHTGRILGRFVTVGSVNKGKSIRIINVSDEVVEDLKARLELSQ